MVAPGCRLHPLLSAGGGPDLPGGPFRLSIPHQACMETPLPEFYPPDDPRPDLPGPADAQRLREDNVGNDKGYLGVPTPVDKPLPFHGQDGCESAPHCSCGRGIPSTQLHC